MCVYVYERDSCALSLWPCKQHSKCMSSSHYFHFPNPNLSSIKSAHSKAETGGDLAWACWREEEKIYFRNRGDSKEGRVEKSWEYRWLNWRKGLGGLEGKRMTHLLAENKWLSWEQTSKFQGRFALTKLQWEMFTYLSYIHMAWLVQDYSPSFFLCPLLLPRNVIVVWLLQDVWDFIITISICLLSSLNQSLTFSTGQMYGHILSCRLIINAPVILCTKWTWELDSNVSSLYFSLFSHTWSH